MSDLQIHSKSKEDYSGNYSDHALEQYKLYVEMADRISSRRQSTKTFFVTLNTVLISIAGYAKSAASVDSFFYLVTSFAGLLICYTWYRLVKSYKNLNSAKFKVVHAMEKEMPFNLFDAEWEAVGRGKDKILYHPFTELELKIPWVFFSIYILVIVYIIPWSRLFEKCM